MASKVQEKPNVVILGATGFIGRNLVKYLVDNKLCNSIVAADKKRPMTNYFHPDHKAAIDSKNVKFLQKDVTRTASVQQLFQDDKKQPRKIDYVFNLCGETRPNMSENDMKHVIVNAATTAAAVAVEHKIKKWVEVSHAGVYAPDSKKSKEDAKIAPWLVQAQLRLEAEQKLSKISGLPLVVLRPAFVYGPGDVQSLTPRLACAAGYKADKKKIEFLHGGRLCINTVHVNDVCKAMWHAATSLQAGSTYNLADVSDMNQGKMNKIMSSIFDMKTGFRSSFVSSAAMRFLDYSANSANAKHAPMWRKVCMDNKVLNTNLSTYIGAELLKATHMSIDGTAITKTGFTYSVPNCDVSTVRAAVQFLISQGTFPAILA